MKKLAWLLPLLWIGAARAGADCDLECSLDRALREEALSGAAYALVQGEEMRVGAVGLAADAKVHIGSVTKTLVALGVLRLVTERRVALDTPLTGLLPRVPLRNRWQARSPVTLRHLLDHTAGLDDLRLWQIFTARAPARASLAAAFARPADLLEVRVAPGTRMSYSNMGYTLAAMVIEERTGERYESWLDRELLRPLGMRDSTFEFVSQQGSAADPRLAWGHHDDGSKAAAQAIWVRPAAQFTTTAADMAALARFLMSDGRIGGEVFVDPGLLRAMGRASSTDAARAGLPSGYGLGLATRDRHGAVGLCHLGNIVGYSATLCLYPAQRRAFFIAFDMDSETANYSRFEELLARELGVARQVPQTTPVAPDVLPRAWEGRYVAAPARFESFRMANLLFDGMRLSVDSRGVEWHRGGAAATALIPQGGNLYRAADRSVASHVLLEQDGEYYVSDGLRTWRRIEGAWLALNWLSLSLGVAGLATLLVLIPWRAMRARETPRQPATAALGMLLLPVPLFALQPFTGIGDLTPASAALWLATLALPLWMAWHALWSWRRRPLLRSWRVHVVAAACVLQWCLALWAWDLLPLALWR
jgi:CubicO group peptidase (beta-lactamase class C family)